MPAHIIDLLPTSWREVQLFELLLQFQFFYLFPLYLWNDVIPVFHWTGRKTAIQWKHDQNKHKTNDNDQIAIV